jgi:hypothetical protein
MPLDCLGHDFLDKGAVQWDQCRLLEKIRCIGKIVNFRGIRILVEIRGGGSSVVITFIMGNKLRYFGVFGQAFFSYFRAKMGHADRQRHAPGGRA